MPVSEYVFIFSDLSRHAPTLVSMVREGIHRFIEGLVHDIQFNNAWELKQDVLCQHVVEIACRIKGIRDQEGEVMWVPKKEDGEAKKSNRPERSTGFYF